MKKLILVVFCFLVISVLLVAVLIFVPFSAPYEGGPKVQYRVEEGTIEVLSLKEGQPQSLLSLVKPGETFTAQTISVAALKIPFWMDWLDPITKAAVGRANLFMLRQSKKSRYHEFAVAYTDESIQRGFTKEIEKTRIFSNVRMNFYTDGFSFSARIGSIPISVRGYASTGGTSDHLFLRLRWVKIGRFFLPRHVLRALENTFLKVYMESSHPSIKLLRITFTDGQMTMFYRKITSNDTDPFQQESPLAAPAVFYPQGA